MLSLFQSLLSQIGKWLPQVFNNLTKEIFKVRHLLIGFVALIFAPINMGLNLITSLLGGVLQGLGVIALKIGELGLQNAPSWWASASAITGQLNAVVPIDYCLVVGAVAASIWLAIQLVRLAVWLYSLIPFKLT